MPPITLLLASLSADLPPQPGTPGAWLPGRWERAEGAGVEDWTRMGDTLVGVSFEVQGGRTTGFEVMSIGPLAPHAGSELVFTAQLGGGAPTRFGLREASADRVRFENPQHDFPTVIWYASDGDALRARIEGPSGKGVDFHFRRGAPTDATALLEADRAFDLAVSTGGLEAWVSAFDPAGSQWVSGARVGHAAIREAMRPLLTRADASLRWTPVAGGLSPAGDLGWTTGYGALTFGDSAPIQTVYLTIWKRQPDGAWKVWWDGGIPAED